MAILCGKGKNGGDGFVVARALHQRGAAVRVVLVGPRAAVEGDARTNLTILERIGVPIDVADSTHAWRRLAGTLGQQRLVVDGLVGTGLRGELTGLLATVVQDVNESGVPVTSIDVPSGLSADAPELSGLCIRATTTVTFGAPKVGLMLPPGDVLAGNVVVADIGIPLAVVDALGPPHLEWLTREDVRRLIPPRPAEAHKGTFGHVLVVAGSAGRTGAAHLAGMGALRAGAGLTTVATPRECQSIVAAMAPEYMTLALEETLGGGLKSTAVEQVLSHPADVIVVGPGLGTGDSTAMFVKALLDRSRVPLVLDADALTVLGRDAKLTGREDGPAVVVTPHPGEMARLVGGTAQDVQARRIPVAEEFAAARRVHVVLKGHRTVVATPSGRTFVNSTGSSALASGGSGDVLSGMIGGGLGQTDDVEAACEIAVFVHGLAGDLARTALGGPAVAASDLLAHVGRAFESVTGRSTRADAEGR